MLKKQTQLDFFFVKNLVNNLEHIGLEKHLWSCKWLMALYHRP